MRLRFDTNQDNNWGGGETPDKFSAALYRADVTAWVQGSGSYAISGLADGGGHSASGASLIVFHDDGNAFNDLRVAHYEAMDSDCAPAGAEHWNARLWLDYTGGQAELILHVADGQEALSDGSYGVRVFPGLLPNESGDIEFRSPHTDGLPLWAGKSVPRMAFPRLYSGDGLWDVRHFDITPTLQKPGRYYIYGRGTPGNDCESLLVMQLVQSAPGQPPAIVPPEHDFGDLAPASVSPAQRFTFTNRQNDVVEVGAVTLINSVYAVTGNTCTGEQLAPGGTCTVDIQCTPAAALRDYRGTLKIAWADAFGEAWDSRARLYCTGVSEAPHGRIMASPADIWFGVVSWGAQSPLARLTAHSTGTVPVTMRPVRLFGTHAGSFQVVQDGCNGLVLAPGQQCSVDLRFRPAPGTGLIVRQATIEFEFSASASIHVGRPIILAGTVVSDDSGIFSNGFESN